MKRWLGVFLIYLFAVSSGITQFSFHSCKKDGLHVLDHNCDAEISKVDAETTKDCCRKSKTDATESIDLCSQNTADITCCQINYYFGFTPVPQKIGKFQLNNFQTYFVESRTIEESQLVANINSSDRNWKIPPKPGSFDNNRKVNLQAPLQVWVI